MRSRCRSWTMSEDKNVERDLSCCQRRRRDCKYGGGVCRAYLRARQELQKTMTGDGRREKQRLLGGRDGCCWLMSHKRRGAGQLSNRALTAGSAASVGEKPRQCQDSGQAHTGTESAKWFRLGSENVPGVGPAVAALAHHTREKSPGLLSNSHIASKDGSFPDNDHLNQPKCPSALRRSASPARYVTPHLQKECVAARWLIFVCELVRY